MEWKTLSLHYKETYDGGHRYLDQCGQIMVWAEDNLDLIPEEASPAGCKMVLPEQSIMVGINGTELTVTQELDITDDGDTFLNICKSMKNIISEVISPRSTQSNGFAIKNLWPFSTIDAARTASLTLAEGYSKELSSDMEMPACEEHIDCHFSAGKSDLHIQMFPATLRKSTSQTQTPGVLATPAQKLRAKRLNHKAENDKKIEFASSAIMLILDLIEFEPPENSFDRHFNTIKEKNEKLRARYIPK